MKKVILLAVCCLCLCGCGKKSTYNECLLMGSESTYKTNLVISFNCVGKKIIDNKTKMTYVFDSTEQAQYFYKEYSLLYDDINLTDTTLKFTNSSGNGSPHKNITNCSKLTEFYQEKGMNCSIKSTD